MSNSAASKVFFSYSHKDKDHLLSLITHLSPLAQAGLIECWYDGKNEAGATFQHGIDTALEAANIVCLLLSPDFLASSSCRSELERTVCQAASGTVIVPIILRSCLWREDERISGILALPEDGKPVVEHINRETAWTYVGQKLKELVVRRTYPKVSHEFAQWMGETELTAILGRDMPLTLDDLFIGFDLEARDLSNGNVVAKTSCEDLLERLEEEHFKIVISGGQQSGKTAMLKKLHTVFTRGKVCLPVYLDMEPSRGTGNITKSIAARLHEQYSEIEAKEITLWEKVLLIDNFHFVAEKDQKRLLLAVEALDGVWGVILIVDDVYDLGVAESLVTAEFKHYHIKPLGYKRRDDLVCRWMTLTGKDPTIDNRYRDDLTSKIEMVRQRAVMPANPFFIYSVIASYEAAAPLSNEITSQGHCYQALIYLALRRAGVRENLIDSYSNFLAELSYKFYQSPGQSLSAREFAEFLKWYKSEYTLPMSDATLWNTLEAARLLRISGLSNVSFTFRYIYYYYVGKYFSDHLRHPDVGLVIQRVMENLDIEQNGYIAVFLVHHTRDYELLTMLSDNLGAHYADNAEAKLDEEEIRHLGDVARTIEPVVIKKVIDTEANRAHVLTQMDDNTQEEDAAEEAQHEHSGATMLTDLRKALKNVEVMGHILKNRLGSIKTTELEAYMASSMRVFLRIADWFNQTFQDCRDEFTTLIEEGIRMKVGKEKASEIGEAAIRDLCVRIFFEFHLLNYYAVIKRSASSLCSIELIPIMDSVANAIQTPLSGLIRKQCLMLHDKHIDMRTLESEAAKMHPIEKRLLCILVVEYCYMNKVNYRNRQRIASILGISEQRLAIADATKP